MIDFEVSDGGSVYLFKAPHPSGARLGRPIPVRHRSHLLGSRREVGSAGSMARAFV